MTLSSNECVWHTSHLSGASQVGDGKRVAVIRRRRQERQPHPRPSQRGHRGRHALTPCAAPLPSWPLPKITQSDICATTGAASGGRPGAASVRGTRSSPYAVLLSHLTCLPVHSPLLGPSWHSQPAADPRPCIRSHNAHAHRLSTHGLSPAGSPDRLPKALICNILTKCFAATTMAASSAPD